MGFDTGDSPFRSRITVTCSKINNVPISQVSTMKRTLAFAAAMAAVSLFYVTDASAQGRRAADSGPTLSDHPKSGYYRKKRGTQVKGYVARRGGYSYSVPDTINTYGSSRTLYGGTFYYRDPMLDRQTRSGPFDHGFFFDSGVAPRGGDSPYMH